MAGRIFIGDSDRGSDGRFLDVRNRFRRRAQGASAVPTWGSQGTLDIPGMAALARTAGTVDARSAIVHSGPRPGAAAARNRRGNPVPNFPTGRRNCARKFVRQPARSPPEALSPSPPGVAARRTLLLYLSCPQPCYTPALLSRPSSGSPDGPTRRSRLFPRIEVRQNHERLIHVVE